MRKYTFLVSLVAHVGVVIAVVMTTLVVTHTLPGVPPMFEFVMVRAEMPPPPEPIAPRPRVAAPVPSAIPVGPAEGVLPEPDVPRVVDDTPGNDGALALGAAGIPGGTGDVVVGEPPPPEPPTAPRPAAPLRIGGSIVAPAKIHHVTPVYPPVAMSARKEGVVVIDAVIGEDGSVRELRVLRSEPLLDQAALDAVRQWRFSPTLLNGEPTSVIMTVTVSFRLR